MIAIIDCGSPVRHHCYDALANEGFSVQAYFSFLRFVASSAFHSTQLLIMGRTHRCPGNDVSLQIASELAPHMDILLLNPEHLLLRSLNELSSDLQEELAGYDSTALLSAFKQARCLGLVPNKSALGGGHPLIDVNAPGGWARQGNNDYTRVLQSTEDLEGLYRLQAAV